MASKAIPTFDEWKKQQSTQSKTNASIAADKPRSSKPLSENTNTPFDKWKKTGVLDLSMLNSTAQQSNTSANASNSYEPDYSAYENFDIASAQNRRAQIAQTQQQNREANEPTFSSNNPRSSYYGNEKVDNSTVGGRTRGYSVSDDDLALIDEDQQLQDEIRKATRAQTLKKYGAYSSESDFNDYAEQGASAGAFTNKVMAIRNNPATLTSGSLGNSSLYTLMTDKEVSTYNYALAKYGKAAANEYLDALEYNLTARKRANDEAATAQAVEKSPILSSAASIATNYAAGAGSIYALAKELTGQEVDPNSQYFTPSRTTNQIVGTVANNIADKSKVGSFAYQTGMSILNNAAMIVTGMPEPVILALMGTNAATSTMTDAFDSGATQSQAVGVGTMAGIAEVLFEKVSLDHLFKISSGTEARTLIKNLLTQSGIEGSEEIFTEVANIMSDTLLMADKSELQQKINAYMQQGMTEAEASAKAYGDLLVQVGLAGAGGFLSGLALGGIGTAQNSYRFGQNLKNFDAAQGLVETGASLPATSRAYQLAQRYSTQQDGNITAKDNLRGGQLTRLYNANIAGLNTETMSNIESRLKGTQNETYLTRTFKSILEGNGISDTQAKVIANNETAKSVFSELTGSDASTLNAESIRQLASQRGYNAQLNASTADNKASEAKTAENAVATRQNESGSTVQAPTVKSTLQTVAPASAEIASVGENATAKLPDGTTVKLADTDFGSKSTLYEAAAKLGNTAAANTMVSGYKGGNIESYIRGFRSMYNGATQGISIKETVERSIFSKFLTEEQQKAAYEAGENVRTAAEVRKRQANAENRARSIEVQKQQSKSNIRERITAESEIKPGVNRDYDDSKLSSDQRMQLRVIDEIFKADGKKIVVHDSIGMDENGKPVFNTGNSRGNAYYDPDTDTYHLALNGVGQAYSFITVHESIHEMAAKNQDGYKKLEGITLGALVADLMEKKGMSFEDAQAEVDRMVKYQADLRGWYTVSNGEHVYSDKQLSLAREEVVANTVPVILTDETQAKRFADRVMQASTDVRNWFHRLINKLLEVLNKAYKRLSQDKSWEQMEVIRKDRAAIQEIADAYFEGMEGAKEKKSDNNQTMMSIQTDREGINYTLIEAADIKGDGINESDTMSRKARIYLRNKFRGVVLPVSKSAKAYVRSEGINEYTNPASYIGTDDYNAKMLAATELDNMLKASDFLKWEKDGGTHPDAVRGWDKYQTYFAVKGDGKPFSAYSGEIQIKKIERGDVFYDITHIKNITDSIMGQSIAEHAQSIGDVSSITEGNSSVKASLRYDEENISEFSDSNVRFSLRDEAPPEETKIGYKVFYVKDGKLYPPMVANPNAEDTPVGVWLNADVGTAAPASKTGRLQVKAGGKGTQGGSGSLSFRPGWHMGEIPYASQFARLNSQTGKKELFPRDFVFAEVEFAADVDYQQEAMSYGYTKNGKFQHSLAGLPRVPKDGFYTYRTNPNPATIPWFISGAIKVNRLLTDEETDALVKKSGREPMQREGGALDTKRLGLSDDMFKTHDKNNTDIRFSLKDVTPADTDIMQEIQPLYSDADPVLQRSFASVENIDIAKVNLLARATLKRFSSTLDSKSFADDLARVFAYMSTPDVVWSEARDVGVGLMKNVLAKSSTFDEETYKSHAPVRDYLRTTGIAFDEGQKAEAAAYAGSWNDYRRALFGRVLITNSGKETLDGAWQSLASMGAVDSSVKEGDMPRELYKLAQTAYAKDYTNEYGYDEDGLAYDMLLQASWQYLDSVGKDTLKARQKLQEIRQSEKKQYQERYAALRDEKNTKIREAKAKYRDRFITYKQQQLNRRRTSFLRGSIEDNAKELRKWLSKPNVKEGRYVPESLRGPMVEFLGAIDFTGPLGGVTKQQGWAASIDTLRNEYNRYTQSHKNTGEYAELRTSEDFADVLNDLADDVKSNRKYAVSQLDSVQLEELDYVIKNLKAAVRNINRMFKNKRYATAVNAGDALIQYASAHKEYQLWRKSAQAIRNFLNVDMLDSYSFFEQFGEAGESISKELDEGMQKSYTHVRAASEFFDGLLKKYGFNERDVLNMTRETRTFKLDSGRNITLTIAQVMDIYNLSKRPQALMHLLGAGIEVSNIAVLGKPDIKQLGAFKLTDSDISSLVKTLTKEQTGLADDMMNFLSTTAAEWGNEVSREWYGVENYRDPHYWPIRVANFELETKDPAQARAMNAVANSSFTKAISKYANNTVKVVDVFQAFSDHIAQMSAYNGLALPIDDAMKWMNYKQRDERGNLIPNANTKLSMERVAGSRAVPYLVNLVKDLNGLSSSSYSTELASKLLSNFKKSAVAGKLRVVIQQPTAIARALSMIDGKYMLQTTFKKRSIKEMQDNAPIAWWKAQGNYEIGVGRSLRSVIIGDDTDLQRLTSAAMEPAGKADDISWAHIWEAVKLEISDKQQSLSGDEYMAAVADRFSDIVNRTQVVDTVLHRSQAMRSKDIGIGQFTAFMSEPTKSYNMLRSSITDVIRSGGSKAAKRKAVRTVMAWLLAQALNAAVLALHDTLRDRDEEDKFGDMLWKQFKEEMLDNVNPLAMIPFAKEIASLIEGYDSTNMTTEVFTNLWNTITGTSKQIAGTSKKTWYHTITTDVKAVSDAFGMPFGGMMSSLETVVNAVFPGALPDNRPTVRSSAESMYFASEKGNARKRDEAIDKISDLYLEKVDDYIKEGSTREEAQEKARTSVLGTCTSVLKPYYQAAKTLQEKNDIKSLAYRISVGGEQLYSGYDFASNWDNK